MADNGFQGYQSGGRNFISPNRQVEAGLHREVTSEVGDIANIKAMQIQNRVTKEMYFITSTVVDWVDVFTRPVYKHVIIESLEYCQKEKGLIIYAWVLMTNHLHVIVGAKEGYNIF